MCKFTYFDPCIRSCILTKPEMCKNFISPLLTRLLLEAQKGQIKNTYIPLLCIVD